MLGAALKRFVGHEHVQLEERFGYKLFDAVQSASVPFTTNNRYWQSAHVFLHVDIDWIWSVSSCRYVMTQCKVTYKNDHIKVNNSNYCSTLKDS